MAKSKILQWPLGTLDFTNGCLVMGVLNITPDSFSDGGDYLDVDSAVDHGLEMISQGASIIDIGPESSRPGSDPASEDVQIKRAIPVIKKLSRQTDIPISIDTSQPVVAAAALDMGASIVNDITAMAGDSMAELVAERNALAILMHMRESPKTMQDAPHYTDVTREVKDYLLERARHASRSGIQRDHIIIDPGIGFGKTTTHNLHLLRDIKEFVQTDYRVLVGTSRKRFIGEITGKEVPRDRTFGTAATVAHCAWSGVSIVRVHDVGQMADVIKITQAIIKGR